MAEENQPPPLPEALSPAPGLPSNVAATAACALPLVGGILFLFLERANAFVRFYAMQSLFFGIAAVVISFALEFMVMLFQHVPVLGAIMLVFILLLKFLFGFAWLIIWILTMFYAFRGVEWEIPYIGPLARKQLQRPL
jgi:uncharacterized membrane protein